MEHKMSDRRRGGLVAKRNGDFFERAIERVCRIQEINLIKIPMGAKIVKSKGQDTIKKVCSPFDYIMTPLSSGRSVFFDAKARLSDRISYSAFQSGSTKHQLKTLYNLYKYYEMAGFIIWFQEPNIISFFGAHIVMTMEPGDSLKFDSGLNLGSLEDFQIERLWFNGTK